MYGIDGFFDAGMLLQALKAREEGLDEDASKPIRRREIGKKLRLSEY
jgi:carnitine O-acetyltransferase